MQKREKEHNRQDRNIKVETKKLRVRTGTKRTDKGKPGKEKREKREKKTREKQGARQRTMGRSPSNPVQVVNRPSARASEADRFTGRLMEDQAPRMHMMAERSKEKVNRQRSQPITTE